MTADRRKPLASADAEVTKSEDALRTAAQNLSDRRTADSDGFWVSQKEMRALDAALAARPSQPAAAPPPAIADAITGTLTVHYVTAIECDHEAKTDTVRCNCSVWTGTPQRSVGDAVQEWIAHVLERFEKGREWRV